MFSVVGSWSNLLDVWHAYRPYYAGFCIFCFLVSLALSLTRPMGNLIDAKPRQAILNKATSPLSNSRSPVAASQAPRRILGSKKNKAADVLSLNGINPKSQPIQPLVFYFSIGGTTETVANHVANHLQRWASTSENSPVLAPRLCDLTIIDYDDYFVSLPNNGDESNPAFFYLILLPSYDIDTTLVPFLDHLKDTHHDFRIDASPLSSLLGYSVFGLGDKVQWPSENEGFCFQAREADKWMARLTGRKRAFPLGMADFKTDWRERIAEWTSGVQEALVELGKGNGLGQGVVGSGAPQESDDESENDVLPEKSKPRRVKSSKQPSAADMNDVEDMGSIYNAEASTSSKKPLAVDFTTYGASSLVTQAKEMVPKSSATYASLTKQGYTIVGSHSGVKICRWTKSALRGRGSCYKFSFYGIKSHLCMETTPSLSCSSKCVFCWRHQTNPTGTTWRWKVDPPEMIFQGVKEGHYQKIRMLKGVPGVRAERFAEAMQIKHCALSLVGEPIFYPHINQFLDLLHNERISSFLVCNAQHPDQLAALAHVTQLYVSIDASNKESLKKIDRPLFRDFWERFLRCLDILKEQRFRQRTVFRLTLVKGFNIEEEAEGYAHLVAHSLPCFIEVKGVTFCGTSTSAGAGLTMQNVPFYHEVCEFVKALLAALERMGLDYGIGAEHSHSCCVLIASTRFRIDGKWHTLIDYDKFFQCLESGRDFGPEDYIGAETPEWALWGNGGFDPRDERWYRAKTRNKMEQEALAIQAAKSKD